MNDFEAAIARFLGIELKFNSGGGWFAELINMETNIGTKKVNFIEKGTFRQLNGLMGTKNGG